MSAVSRLHVVTDDEILSDSGFLSRAAEVLEAGGVALSLHLRGPVTDGHYLYDLAMRLKPVAEACGAQLSVNERLSLRRSVCEKEVWFEDYI